MKKHHHISDRVFAVLTVLFAAVLWWALQGAVDSVYAAEAAPEPISFTAAVGVSVAADDPIRDDAVTITQEVNAKED